MYVVAVVGNVTMLAVVRVEHSLHQPMYFFLCMSAIIALVLSRHLPCRGFWPLCSCDTLPHTTVLMHTVVGCLGLADLCWGVLYIEPLPLMICLQLPPLQSPCPLPLLLGTPGCGHLGRWWQQGQQCLWMSTGLWSWSWTQWPLLPLMWWFSGPWRGWLLLTPGIIPWGHVVLKFVLSWSFMFPLLFLPSFTIWPQTAHSSPHLASQLLLPHSSNPQPHCLCCLHQADPGKTSLNSQHRN